MVSLSVCLSIWVGSGTLYVQSQSVLPSSSPLDPMYVKMQKELMEKHEAEKEGQLCMHSI